MTNYITILKLRNTSDCCLKLDVNDRIKLVKYKNER